MSDTVHSKWLHVTTSNTAEQSTPRASIFLLALMRMAVCSTWPPANGWLPAFLAGLCLGDGSPDQWGQLPKRRVISLLLHLVPSQLPVLLLHALLLGPGSWPLQEGKLPLSSPANPGKLRPDMGLLTQRLHRAASPDPQVSWGLPQAGLTFPNIAPGALWGPLVTETLEMRDLVLKPNHLPQNTTTCIKTLGSLSGRWHSKWFHTGFLICLLWLQE